VTEPLLPSREPPRDRRAVVGYTMVAVAATLFGLNGAVSKVALTSGLSSLRLTEARSAGACVALTAIALARAPSSLRVRRRELPRLAVFGIVGVAFVQLFYFLAIHRLPVGIALLIQYIGPVLVAVWARTFGHEHVRRHIWLALALSLAGLALMVQLWSGVTLDGLGVTFALIAAVVFAVYLLLAEREVQRREAIPLLAWGFFFAVVFWTVVQPWWTFPAAAAGRTVPLQGHLSSTHHRPHLAHLGRREPAPVKRRSRANAMPIPACAIAVPAAEPAMPQWKPYTNATSRTMFTMLAATTTCNGRRRLDTPRR
jgi:drug/metabolite transporter (DMT)-like permease